MHCAQSDVRSTVDRSAVDVVSKEIILKDKNADVVHRTEVDVFGQFVLKEAIVDEREEEPLSQCYRKTSA